MAKIKPYRFTGPPYDHPVIAFIHWGDLGPGPYATADTPGSAFPNPWHSAWVAQENWELAIAVNSFEVPPRNPDDIDWIQWLLDSLTAALYFVNSPMLIADICPLCHYSLLPSNNPTIPRFNIYRGTNEMIVPPSVYWDWPRDPIPPPGFGIIPP